MQCEMLSIETAQKIAKLEKENKQLSNMICAFDKEINRLSNIIKDVYKYVDEELFAENVQIKDLKRKLNTAYKKEEEIK